MNSIFEKNNIFIVKIDSLNIENDFLFIKILYDNEYKNICYKITDNYVIFDFNPNITSFRIEIFNKINDSYNDIIYDVIVRIDKSNNNICYFKNSVIEISYKNLIKF